MTETPPTEYLHLVQNILQRDLKALQINHTLQLVGDRVKYVRRQTFAAERRSGFLKLFAVYRVMLPDGEPATRIKRAK